MAQANDTENAGTQGYVRGKMDIADQQATWSAFTVWAKWGTLLVMGFTFFLIFWLVGGIPFVVSLALIAVLMAAIAWFFS